jgi:hypothetical protein
MERKRRLSHSRQDYSEEQLYAGFEDEGHSKLAIPHDWEDKNDQGGIFSYSEVGGDRQDQQNPWQGPQERWQQP